MSADSGTGHHNAASMLREARAAARLTLRTVAERADTSHSTIAAYEAGRKTPTAETLARLLACCGTSLATRPLRAVHGAERIRRGRELAEVLRLAAVFPVRHKPELMAPRFGQRIGRP